MRYGSKRLVRLYYTTPQVLENLEIEHSFLLQIEKTFPLIVVNKNRAGKKVFRHRDFLLIEIAAIGLQKGMSVPEIQDLLAQIPDRHQDQWQEEILNQIDPQETLSQETSPEAIGAQSTDSLPTDTLLPSQETALEDTISTANPVTTTDLIASPSSLEQSATQIVLVTPQAEDLKAVIPENFEAKQSKVVIDLNDPNTDPLSHLQIPMDFGETTPSLRPLPKAKPMSQPPKPPTSASPMETSLPKSLHQDSMDLRALQHQLQEIAQILDFSR